MALAPALALRHRAVSPRPEEVAVLRARLVTTLSGLESLQTSWDRLHCATAGATPWQSFAFMRSWWANLGGKHLLRIVVVERGGTPCLILPLQVARWPWLPGIPVQILEPIGSIMDVNRPRLALGADDPEAYARALALLAEHASDWHLIRIDEKLADEFEVGVLRQFAARERYLFQQAFSHLCPWLSLEMGWEQFLAGRGAKLLKNLRAARRRIEALGPVSLRKFEGPTQVLEGLDVVWDLHARSWKRRKKIEHSQSQEYRRFFRQWLAEMGNNRQARVLALYCGDRPVAATIAFLDAHTYYSAQIVHDREFASCSPGTLLEFMEFEDVFAQGRWLRYDFLGSFLTNKLRWTDTSLPTTHVFVVRPLLRTRVLCWYYFSLKPRVRPPLVRLLERARSWIRRSKPR
jgi:CelD/BcsL family acetyltransferase involved in cellulose biosynthesis